MAARMLRRLRAGINPADIASVEAYLPRDTMRCVAEPAAAKDPADQRI